MSEFSQYRRTNIAEMRPYVKGEDLSEVSVSNVDNPETDMGVIARNPNNHKDQWYVAREYFEENFESIGSRVKQQIVVVTLWIAVAVLAGFVHSERRYLDGSSDLIDCKECIGAGGEVDECIEEHISSYFVRTELLKLEREREEANNTER